MIRARNAGSYLVSIDVAFDDDAMYRACRDRNVFDRDLIADLYDVTPEQVAVIPHDPSRAIKVTLPRQHPSGHPADTDIDSSQQYVPLLALTVPVVDDNIDEPNRSASTPGGITMAITSTDVINRPTISSALAQRVIDAAVAGAQAQGDTAFAIAIVDESGVLKAFHRMDGAALVAVQISQDKAYTAVGFKMPSHGWYDFIKDDGPLALGATDGIDRLVIFGGGYPITVDGEVVGGIGVSGGHYSQDQKVAEAGLTALT